MNLRRTAFFLAVLSLPTVSGAASEWGPWKTLTTKDNVRLDFRVLDGKQYDQVQWRAVNNNPERAYFSVVDKRYYTAGANQNTWKEGPDEGSDVRAGKTYGLMPDTVETNVGRVEAVLQVNFPDRKETPKATGPAPAAQPKTGGGDYWGGGGATPPAKTTGTPKPAPTTAPAANTPKGAATASGQNYWGGQATGGPAQAGGSGKTPGSKLTGGNITRVPDGPPNGSIRPKDKAAPANQAGSNYWGGGGTNSDTAPPATASNGNKSSTGYWGDNGSSNTPDTSRLGQSNRQLGGSIRDTQDRTHDTSAAYRRREAAEEEEAADARRRRAAQEENEEEEDLAARIAAKRAEDARLLNQLRELSGGNFNPPPASSSSSNYSSRPAPLLTIAPDRSAEIQRAQQQAQAAAEARQREASARAHQAMENENRLRAAEEARRAANRVPGERGRSIQR